MPDPTPAAPAVEAGPELRLRFAAISDVGRVRKDNQDSGYAGPWLLAVCDGVGGAARGDIASATAIGQLRRLDAPPETSPAAAADDPEADQVLLGRVAGALHRAHDRIAEIVDEDASLGGTSTTATVTVFDGHRVGVGHVGDSRGYLFRAGALRRLTHDHTFVQTLVDEGRISEAESRVHPHRNLILKALDGATENEPDLFVVPLEPGDRLFLCSDGACGVLDDGRLADILSGGTADYAAVELVRASLEAGSSDNVTCIVADVEAVPVTTPDGPPSVAGDGSDGDPAALLAAPLVVGAAAELRRRTSRTAKVGASIFRGHRSGDTGELEPIDAEIAEDYPRDYPAGYTVTDAPVLDPEAVRYAPRAPVRHVWLRRVLALAVVVGVVWVGAAAAWSWSQDQYYVGEQGGTVTIFRGIDASLPGVSLSHAYESTNVQVGDLSEYDADKVAQGIEASDLSAAHSAVASLAAKVVPDQARSTGSGTGTDGSTP